MQVSYEIIVSGGEVNRLSDGRCGERLPAVNLSHVDLSRSEQRPEQHGGGFGGGQHGLRRLNSSCSRSMAFVVLAVPTPICYVNRSFIATVVSQFLTGMHNPG